MEKQKFRISIIDFLLEHGKHPINAVDSTGEPLYFGDLVKRDGANWFICYRYGKVVLKQPETIYNIHISDWTTITKEKNTIGAGMDWLIIGYTNDPIYEQVKHVEHSIVEP